MFVNITLLYANDKVVDNHCYGGDPWNRLSYRCNGEKKTETRGNLPFICMYICPQMVGLFTSVA